MTANAGNSGIQGLMQVTNLYLTILEFRFPPLNVVQEGPNILTFLPPHSDSILLFADIIRRYANDDWRYAFIEAALFRIFDKEYPDSLKLSHELGIPLASVFLPVVKENEKYFEILVPTRYPHVLKISIENSKAILTEISEYDGLSRQESLWLRKRDNIAKLGIIRNDNIKLIKMTTTIGNRSGGYRAIDVLLKVPVEYLSTKMVFLASIRDVGILEEELKTLKKMGVGKKRDMGFGDLIRWKVYPIESSDNVGVVGPMALAHGEADKLRIVTLRNIPSFFIANLKEKGGLLPLNMRMVLSRTKPPYWIREELCISPFSEFLLKK